MRGPFDVHRGDQPRSGDHLRHDRFANRRPAVASARGSPTGSVREATICRRSSCSSRPDKADQPLFTRAVGQRLPAVGYQGVQFRAERRSRPLSRRTRTACDRARQRACSTRSTRSTHRSFEHACDPEIRRASPNTRWPSACRPACRSYRSLQRTDSTLELYGPDVRKPGTFAANCLLARRLAERGVRFIQLYHQRLGPARQSAARHPDRQCRRHRPGRRRLVTDLKQRGMLDDTLVIWGGEFGRPSSRKANSPTTTTAATITHAVSACGSPAAASRAACPTARPMTSPTTSSGPRPRPRLERHHPALPRHRPRAIHLQVPGPRPTPHGCAAGP